MTIENAIERYLKHSELTKSNGTYKYELSHLKFILNYFNELNFKKMNNLTEEVISNFIIYLRNRNNENTTINKRINLLKQVFKHNKIDNEFLFEFNKLKEIKKRFDLLTLNELNKIFYYIDNLNELDPIQLTEKIVIYLFFETGIRRNELLNIQIEYIDLQENTILLKETKSKTERIVFFTNDLKELFVKYFKFEHDRKYLLFNYRVNKNYNSNHIRRLFEKLKRETGIPVIHPHMLRHTFATMYLENDGSLTTLQQMLGHQNLKTTQIYLHMSTRFHKRNYDKHFSNIYNTFK